MIPSLSENHNVGVKEPREAPEPQIANPCSKGCANSKVLKEAAIRFSLEPFFLKNVNHYHLYNPRSELGASLLARLTTVLYLLFLIIHCRSSDLEDGGVCVWGGFLGLSHPMLIFFRP